MAKTEWLKKALPQGFKKEFLGPEQQSHRISRGRDFLEVELLRYQAYLKKMTQRDKLFPMLANRGFSMEIFQHTSHLLTK